MGFLIMVFAALLAALFGIFALLLRPAKQYTQMERRIALSSIARAEVISPNMQMPSLALSSEPSAFRWIENLIGQRRWTKKLSLLILQSHSDTSNGKVMAAMTLSGVCCMAVVFWFTSNVLIAPGAGLLFASIPIAWLRMKRSKRVAAFNAVLPDAIETCARSLRAGHSIVSAINIVAEQSLEPVKEEFYEVFKKQNYGLPLRDALEQMLERMPSPDLRVLVTGILVQKDTGGNLAEIMDRIALVIRDRIRIAGEVRTHTAQGRFTGWILVLLPVVMLLVINLVNPGYSSILFTNPAGRRMLYIGLTLLIVGGLLIRKIVKGIEV